jgi:predicted nucleic acid-binding protein
LGLTELRGFLQRHRRIALDTSVFIYQIEADPRYVALADTVFEWLERPNRSALTSTITMMELLVYPHLDWIAFSLGIADIAARFRARHRLKPPDAIQAATAVKGGAAAPITNGAVFERIELFETAVLGRFHPNQNS